MNNSKIDPNPSGRFDILETCWQHLTWVQKKTLRLKIMFIIFISHHIKYMVGIQNIANHRINHFVLYWIFPAHWIKH